MWQAWRKVWEVKEISDVAKESLMNKIDQQEKKEKFQTKSTRFCG